MRKVFLEILQMGLVSGYAILIVLLVRRLLRRFPKRYSYILWSVVFFRLVCPVGTESQFSLIPSALAAEATFNEEEEKDAVQPDTQAGEENRIAEGMSDSEILENVRTDRGNVYAPMKREADSGILSADIGVKKIGTENSYIQNAGLIGAVREPERSQNADDRENMRQRFLSAACAIWIAGIAIFWLIWARSICRFRKKLAGAVRVEEGVYESGQLAASFVDGVLHPVIYLAPGLSGTAREYVLCHERVHVRRKDPLIKAAALFLVSIYWFHPLVWLAFQRMCEDMEMSCDERVVELLGAEIKKEYSCTLLQMAAKPEKIGLTAAFGGNEVKNRVRNVLTYRKPKGWVAVLLLLLVAAVSIGLSLNPGKAAKVSDTGTDQSADAQGNTGNQGEQPGENENAGGQGKQADGAGRGEYTGNPPDRNGDDGKQEEDNSGGKENEKVEAGSDGNEETSNLGNGNENGESSLREEAERQLQLILAQRELWQMSEEYMLPYGRYTIADLNQNGRLEIIGSSCQGTGIYTVSNVYEVSENMDSLVHYERVLPEEYSEADIMVASAPVYYDKTENRYQYVFYDLIKNGAAYYYESLRGWSLQDGQIVEQYLASCTTEYVNSNPQITYAAGDIPGIPVTNETEYAAAADTVFAGWQKGTVYFGWVEGVDESVYDDAEEIEEAWRRQLLESYEGFSIVWGDDC